ncbi:MAG: 30S ribosomal protein S20, partial [Verrucomicrobiota bacterium]
RLKAFRRETLEAVEAKKGEDAQAAYNKLASAADKAAKRGAIHKNAASRIKSRAAAQLNGLSA